MKLKKDGLLSLIFSGLLVIIFVVGCGVCFSRMPENTVVTAEDGSTVTKTVRSYTADGGWYYGTSSGQVVKCDANGSLLYKTSVGECGIRSLVSDENYDGLLCLDENYGLYNIHDDGEKLITSFIKTFSGGYYAVTFDDNYAYFAKSVGRYTSFEKYPAYALNGEPIAEGEMYTCVKQGTDYVFRPVVSGTIIGMYADSLYLYIITGEGQYHRIDKNFSLNNFESKTSGELAAIGAIMAGDGTVTIPATSYNKELYLTSIKQLAANGAAYNEQTGEFYIAGTEAECATLDKSFKEVSGKKISLPNTPATGAMCYSPERNKIYIAYENINSVTVIDASEMKIDYNAEVSFYISGMVAPSSGNKLLTVCSGNNKDAPDAKELLIADIDALGHKKLFKTLGILCTVAALLSSIVCLFAGLAVFKKGFRRKFVLTVKGMLKSWITYLIIIGSLSMLILFCYYPGISSMVLSFFDYTQSNPTMHFNNFDNYRQIFSDPANLIAFRNMLIFILSDVVTALLPPCVFAVCLVFMRNKKCSTFARIILFIPTVLPGIATLLIWTKGIYGVDGVVNMVIKIFRGEDFTPILFFQDHGMFSLIMMGFPFIGAYLVFYGALVNVPSSYFEAAELDGCPLIRRIFTIDLPLITPQIKYVFILSFIQSVQNFGRVLMTTDGQFDTQIPIVLMYKKLQAGDYGLSSAYATLMFLILIVVTVLNMKIQTEDSGL